MAMSSKNFPGRAWICLLFSLGCTNLAAVAFDSQVYDNLMRSRQALLEQKDHLQDSADRIGQQIDNLNRQLDTVNAYLRDTDSAIKDVESTLARED